MSQVYDADTIREKLVTNDRWLARGILAIYDQQTADEQSSQTTKHHNRVGFTGCDAAILSSFAKQILTWQATENPRYNQPLSPKQFALARRSMPKYSGQLARIVEASNMGQMAAQSVIEAQEEQAEFDAEREAIMAVELGW